MMDFYDAVKLRRSERHYTPEPVDRETLLRIADAGRLAPSGMNRQEWRFVIVDDNEVKAQIAQAAEYGKFIADAGACIAIFYSDQAATHLEDCSAAAQSIILAATAEGLGSCWVSSHKAPHSKIVAKALGAPASWSLAALIAVGHVKARAAAPIKKSLEEVVGWNVF